MKKSLILSIALLITEGLYLSAQDLSSNCRALNIPLKKYGISFGNSIEFSGIRVNFRDSAVKHVNGLNLTFWLTRDLNNIPVVNGINIGFLPTATISQPITVGLYGTGSKTLNGISVGGIAVGTLNANGLIVSGFVIAAGNSISGLSFAPIDIYSNNSINGCAVGVASVVAHGNINGVVADLGYVKCSKTVSGVTITAGYLNSSIYKGIAIAGFSGSIEMHGLSFAIINHTEKLHGLQVGLLNYAGNNHKGLRMLPFFNLHLRREETQPEGSNYL